MSKTTKVAFRWIDVLVIVVMIFGAPMSAFAAPSPTGATIASDLADYAPGATVTLTGAGWVLAEPVYLFINDDAGQTWSHSADVQADLTGGFVYQFQLPNWFVANYSVTATGPISGTATTSFTDLSIGTYDQCSNDDGDGYTSPPGDTGCHWINGNLNSNNSTYFEGDATVQRLWLTGFAPGTTHTVTFKYGTTKGGKHAYDFLTRWDWSESWITVADRCEGIAGCQTATDTYTAIPVDANANGYDAAADLIQPRQFTMRGGTLNSAGTPTLVSGTYAGDSETVITVNFTVGPSAGSMCPTSGPDRGTCSVAIWFGAHVATQADWGFGNGAGNISGSPYHVALDAVDNASVGQRDNQMQANAIANGNIVIIKNAVPNDAQDFNFNINDGGLLSSDFSLDDDNDGTLSNSQTFNVPPGTWYVSELDIPSNWSLTVLSCEVSSGGTSTTLVDLGAATVTITLDASDTVTCTFTDEFAAAPALEVTKTANPTSLPEPGGDVDFTVRVDNAGNTSLNLTSLQDDVYGDLNGQGDCLVPQTIAVGGFYECTFNAPVTGAAGSVHTDTVTATASGLTDSDDATVTITDVGSSILVTKTADPTSVSEPGGLVTFTVQVDNTSTTDDVTITSLTDDVHGDLNGQGDCAVPQIIAAGDGYSCSFTATVSGNAGDSETDIATASGTDDDGNPVSDSDDATVTVTDVAPSISVSKTANPTSVSEPGGNVTFSVVVTNNSTEDVTLTSLVDDVYGDLNGQGDCAIGGTISANGGAYSCSFTGAVSGEAGSTHTDTVTATAEDNDGSEATASDDATVTLTDVAPSISVDKSADPETLPEPGGDVEFTVVVTNNSTEDVTLTSLVDDVYGDLNGQGTCATGGTLAANGGTYTCSFTGAVSGNAGSTHTDTVTAVATDDDGSTDTAEDDATVTLTDVAPSISVDKSADPETLPEPGGDVEFTVVVTNNSTEDVTLTSLVDDVYGDLNGQGTCATGGTLAANGGTYTCSFTGAVSGNAGSTHTDTATAVATDDDGSTDTAEDDATVTLTDVAPTVDLDKSADPLTLPEPGGVFTFTLVIKNLSSESVTITDLTDDNALSASCLALIGTTLAANDGAPGGADETSCSYTVTHTDAGTYDNTATVEVTDNEGSTGEDSDDETVTVTDVLPTITVDKTANPTSVNEPGGNVTFTFEVTNNSVEAVTISELSDSDFGTLTGDANCQVGTVLGVGESCEFSIIRFVAGDASDPDHVNTFTGKATDNDGNTAEDRDDATVGFDDVLPRITVDKTANPTAVPETGANVTFTFTVTNNSVEQLTITSFSDSDFGTLAGDADCHVGTVLGVGGSCSFSEIHFIAGDFESGIDHINTFTAHATDNENNDASDTDDATVDFTNVTANIDVEKYVSVDSGATWIDADSPTGPYATQGSTVRFKFVVTNNSTVTLSNIILTDSDFNLSGCPPIPATLAPGASYECIISTTAVTGQHTNTATASGSFTDGAGNVESDSDTDDANYFGLRQGQPSISIRSLSISINATRTTVTGQFNITDESQGGNNPDGFLIALTDYGVKWEQKSSSRNSQFAPVVPSGGCTYTIVSVDYPQAAGWMSGDDIIFDESVTIGYTCTFGSTQLTRGGTLRGTAFANIFGRAMQFTYSNTASIPR